MRVSFTGPEVLTPAQHKFVEATVASMCSGWSEVTSGCAAGVDTVAFDTAVAGDVPVCRLVIPAAPHNDAFIARYMMRHRDDPSRFLIEYAPEGATRGESYMLRNDLLVFHCERLIAFPATANEVLRSGTWATIRRAAHASKPVDIFPLDESGTVQWQ